MNDQAVRTVILRESTIPKELAHVLASVRLTPSSKKCTEHGCRGKKGYYISTLADGTSRVVFCCGEIGNPYSLLADHVQATNYNLFEHVKEEIEKSRRYTIAGFVEWVFSFVFNAIKLRRKNVGQRPENHSVNIENKPKGGEGV